MFGIGGGEFIALVILALVLIGPDKLPTFARDAAKYLHKARGLASKATEELRENLGPGFEDLQVTDLHPKKLIQKTLDGVVNPKDFDFTDEVEEVTKSAKIDPDLL
jgi:sec-independent protein translocase protein TatB